MPYIKSGYMSTSKIAKLLNIERDFLFTYLSEKKLLHKNENKNRFELTDLGILKGGEYQSSQGDSKWVIWNNDFIHDEVFDEFMLDKSTDTPQKKIVANMWEGSDLKRLLDLIRHQKSIEDLSEELNIKEEDILKKINSLPRVKKLYEAYSKIIICPPSVECDDEETLEGKIKEYKEVIQLLVDGVNPFSGEVFEYTHICKNIDIVHALEASVKALDKEIRREKRRNDLPPNAGKSWTEEEDDELLIKFNDGIEIKEIAEFFKRSVGSIRSRLLNMGILTPSNEKKPKSSHPS